MTQAASLTTNTRNNQAPCCLVEAGGSWYKEVHTFSLSVQALVRIAKNSSNLQPCPSNQIPLWVQDSAVQYCGWDLSDSQGSHRDCVGHASSVPHVIIAFYDPCKVTSYSWWTSLHKSSLKTRNKLKKYNEVTLFLTNLNSSLQRPYLNAITSIAQLLLPVYIDSVRLENGNG